MGKDTGRPEGAFDLPNGGWAKLRDRTELTNGQRLLLQRHVVPFRRLRDVLKERGSGLGDPEAISEALTVDELEMVNRAQAAFIVTYLAAWSLERPLPTMDTVDDLEAVVFDAIAGATTEAAADGAADGSVDFEVNPAAGSPTEPSRASRRPAGASRPKSTSR